ncbi:hypothetical protein [Providencia hangzhouensis]|uniref:hypothetical protein n=1 Tax=Providencia hangzhouensis TaxID=3031799 RepID=UPI003F69182E
MDANNLKQLVELGEIALHELTSNQYRSDSKDFDIVLKNCSTETYKTQKSRLLVQQSLDSKVLQVNYLV